MKQEELLRIPVQSHRGLSTGTVVPRESFHLSLVSAEKEEDRDERSQPSAHYFEVCWSEGLSFFMLLCPSSLFEEGMYICP